MTLRKAETLTFQSGMPFFNGLAGYYALSGLFFELDYDIIITGNEQYAGASSYEGGKNESCMIAERIRRIIDGAPHTEPALKDTQETPEILTSYPKNSFSGSEND